MCARANTSPDVCVCVLVAVVTATDSNNGNDAGVCTAPLPAVFNCVRARDSRV